MPPIIFKSLLLGTFFFSLTAIFLFAVRMFVRRTLTRRRRDAAERKCRCGYILKGLALPRCPECGRAIGFDKSFEELGISPDELRQPGHSKQP